MSKNERASGYYGSNLTPYVGSLITFRKTGVDHRKPNPIDVDNAKLGCPLRYAYPLDLGKKSGETKQLLRNGGGGPWKSFVLIT